MKNKEKNKPPTTAHCKVTSHIPPISGPWDHSNIHASILPSCRSGGFNFICSRVDWYGTFCDFRNWGTLLPVRYVFMIFFKFNCRMQVRHFRGNFLLFFHSDLNNVIFFLSKIHFRIHFLSAQAPKNVKIFSGPAPCYKTVFLREILEFGSFNKLGI